MAVRASDLCYWSAIELVDVVLIVALMMRLHVMKDVDGTALP